MTELASVGPQHQGPLPLLLLHGFPLDASMWDDVVEVLGLQGVPTLAVDSPGFGQSEVPDGEPSLDLAADAVVATLEELGIDRVVVAGLSMGGYIALALAERYPERVAGIALLDTKATADTDAARANRLRIAQEALGEAGADAVAPMLTALLGATTLAEDPEVVEELRGRLAAAPPAGIAWGQRAMAGRPDRLAVLEHLTVPGLVLRGEEDEISTAADAEAMLTALRAGGGSAELAVVPAAGHMTANEDPVETATALADFWERCTAPSGATD